MMGTASFFNAADSLIDLRDDERRRDQRRAQGHRVVSLAADGCEHPFRLLNLSVRGASGKLDFPARTGMAVLVIFENGLSVSGVVRTIVGERTGIEFGTPIPLDVVENQMRVEEGSVQRRYLRKRADYDVTLVLDGRPMDAKVTDISLGGIRVLTPLQLVPGQQLIIEWRDAKAPAQHAHVRWSVDRLAGIMFAVPVQPKALSAERCRVATQLSKQGDGQFTSE